MKIKVEEYNSNWAADFLEEQRRIIKVLENLFLTVDHIGSTSVTGLGAKPVIDILVGLKDESYLDKVIAPMMMLATPTLKYMNQVCHTDGFS